MTLAEYERLGFKILKGDSVNFDGDVTFFQWRDLSLESLHNFYDGLSDDTVIEMYEDDWNTPGHPHLESVSSMSDFLVKVSMKYRLTKKPNSYHWRPRVR